MDTYIMEWLPAEFELGRRDCALFVFNRINDDFGKDVLQKFRGKYRSAMDVGRLLVETDSKSIEEMIVKEMIELGFEEDTQGEIALCRITDEVYSFALSYGDRVVGFNEEGIIYFSDNNVIKRWRVC